MSGDGRYVVFASGASNIVNGDLNDKEDIFLRDLELGTTVLASITPPAAFLTTTASSPLSQRMAATSHTPCQRNARCRRHVRRRHHSDPACNSNPFACQPVVSGGDANLGPAGFSALSEDGRFVAFTSRAANHVTGDSNGRTDAFVFDRINQTTTRASQGPAGQQGNGDSVRIDISADGHLVVFETSATNFAPNDTNSFNDIFLKNMLDGSITRSSASTLQVNWPVLALHHQPSPRDGQRVAFSSVSSNLLPMIPTGLTDIFVRDVQDGTTRLVSVSSSGAPGNSTSQDPFISGNGRYVAFTSFASNLVQGDGNATSDAFVHDLETSKTYLVSMTPNGSSGTSFQMQSISLMMAGTSLFPLLPAIWLPTTPMEKPTFFVVDGFESLVVWIASNRCR